MNTKRLLALVLCVLMLASLIACDKNNDEPAVTTTAQTTAATTAATTDPETPPTEEGPKVITIAEALALCGEPGDVTEERYEIRATVKTITNPQYGAMVIYDETGEISVYGTYSADGSIGYAAMEEKPYKGDDVVLHCILQNYKGNKEVQNARLISFTSNQGKIDISEYTPATIAEARAAGEGANLKVSGTVARITYANGMKPNGFILVNGADSIYVYDGDAAARVAIGNKVELAASKTYWILPDEQNNAASYGYKGCNQLEGATLISVENTTNEWVSDAIPTATVKELMDNPVSNDITTQVYKVTALVKKSVGTGFVNYYIDDLDETTGSYTYTQCNGSDFGWLDEFDGKICTVYLVVLNAKSTASGCVYRFLPLKVVDEGFTFNTENAPEFAVKYHGLTQFENTYSGNPALEVTTSVSSTLLGFEGATLSYSSSDESVIKFETVEDALVMNCLASGTATVTVTGTYGEKSYTATIEITVEFPTEEISSITVSQAIATENGQTVTVKGIVGPSLVNQVGFYLIDESGVIAVRTDSTTMGTLALGNEVIISGIKKLSKDTDGQICITDAALVQNNYGSHEYSTASFIKNQTIADVCGLNLDTIHTVEVYVVEATIRQETTAYSVNTYVGDENVELMLYAGGRDQYKWLADYAGQTVKMELAVCDWNNKGNKGCVLSITLEDGTKLYNELNFAK